MKNHRTKNSRREEWGTRAQAVVDRPVVDAQPKAVPAKAAAAKPRRKNVQRIRDRAHDEWMKWAQVIVDHLAATASKSVTDSSDEPAALQSMEPVPPRPSRLGAASSSDEKPGRGDWMKWAQVVVDRLTTCVRVYSKPPHHDVFMADKERQDKNGRALDLLRRIHALTDEADTPTDSLTELEHHDERVIAGLRTLFVEVLARLPELSTDMQKLLKSPWLENCNGRLADELFRGPLGGHEPEGIGSGYAEHGRLPESLHSLMEQEQLGDGRHPREALRGPHAHTPRWQGETTRRWVEHNNHLLRTAGRVE